MGAYAHLGEFSNSSLHCLHFCFCQNGSIFNLTNQGFFIIFLISSMRTTLLLSFDLILDQRRSQSSACFGNQSDLFFFGSVSSMASLLFNFIQFSFKWPVSLWYWQESSGFREPSIPRASGGGLGFHKYGLPVYPSVSLDVFWGLLPPLMFKLLATA